MLGNLLDNARRHAGPGALTVTVSGGYPATVLVTDDGPGVPPADRERIFDRLVRLDEARGEDGGAGLGLAIAQKAVGLHGGEISAEESPLGGARFVTRIPC